MEGNYVQLYLQDKLATIAENAAILWSTLEAISDAMKDANRAMEIYKKAVCGTADKAYHIKQEMNQVLDELWR